MIPKHQIRKVKILFIRSIQFKSDTEIIINRDGKYCSFLNCVLFRKKFYSWSFRVTLSKIDKRGSIYCGIYFGGKEFKIDPFIFADTEKCANIVTLNLDLIHNLLYISFNSSKFYLIDRQEYSDVVPYFLVTHKDTSILLLEFNEFDDFSPYSNSFKILKMANNNKIDNKNDYSYTFNYQRPSALINFRDNGIIYPLNNDPKEKILHLIGSIEVIPICVGDDRIGKPFKLK